MDDLFGLKDRVSLKIQKCEITSPPPQPKKDILEPYGCDFVLAMDA